MDSLKKVISTIIALTMVTGAFAILIPYGTASDTSDVMPMDYIAIDLGYKIRAQIYTEDEILTDLDASRLAASKDIASKDWEVNDTNAYFTWNDAGWLNFTKLAEGDHCEIWVADDCSFPQSYRNDGTIVVDQDDAEYMAQQFDETIYPTETEYFSAAPALNGSNAVMPEITEDPNDYFNTSDAGKVMIMVFNIVDTNYDDPSYPYYIVGYYTSTASAFYDRNIIHIDCFDWANRTTGTASSPYVYEGTVAHEYQHLLHDYVDPLEDTWINEGCSMYAQALCGYGYDYDDIAYFLRTPDNSLTEWGDQGDVNILADYGVALLFMVYMNDHFGGSEMISAIMQNQMQGTDSITDSLRDLGYSRMTFDKVFRNWRLANLLWTDEFGDGAYNYDSISQSDIDQAVLELSYDAGSNGMYGTDFEYEVVDTPTTDYTIYKEELGAYGTDYVHITHLPTGMEALFSKFIFDGDDESDIGWKWKNQYDYLDPHYSYWWNRACWVTPEDVGKYYTWDQDNIKNEDMDWGYDQADVLLTTNLDLTGEDGNCSNMTHWFNATVTYQIETGYDFCFVQVSTDGGLTWTSLNDTGDYFTEEEGGTMESIADNLPGLTGTDDFWYSYLTFDLSDYDGQEIMLGFRYMTDWSYARVGLQLFDASVDGEEIDLRNDFTPVYDEMDWLVTMYAPASGDLPPMIVNIPTNDATEVAQRLMGAFMFYDDVYVLISPTSGLGDYYFDITSRGGMFMG